MASVFGWVARNGWIMVMAFFSAVAALAALTGSVEGTALGLMAVVASAAIQIRLSELRYRLSRRATRRISEAIHRVFARPLRAARREVYADQRWVGTVSLEDLANGTHASDGNVGRGHAQRWTAIAESLQEHRDAVLSAVAADQPDLPEEARRAVAQILEGLNTGSRCAHEMARHFDEEADREGRLQDDPMAAHAATRVIDAPRARSYAELRSALQAALKAWTVLDRLGRK